MRTGDALLAAKARKARDGVYPRRVQTGAAAGPLLYLEILGRPDAPALLLRDEYGFPFCDLASARIKGTHDARTFLWTQDGAGVRTWSLAAESVKDGLATPASVRNGLVQGPRVCVQHVHLDLPKEA